VVRDHERNTERHQRRRALPLPSVNLPHGWSRNSDRLPSLHILRNDVHQISVHTLGVTVELNETPTSYHPADLTDRLSTTTNEIAERHRVVRKSNVASLTRHLKIIDYYTYTRFIFILSYYTFYQILFHSFL